MFCPYYKNKDVFDGFNNIIQALGGKPMTEEEFKEFIKEVEKRENKEKQVYHLVKRLGGIFIPKNKKGQVCTRKNYRNRLQDAGKCKVNVELMILIHLLDLVTEQKNFQVKLAMLEVNQLSQCNMPKKDLKYSKI